MADFALPMDLLASASAFGFWINLAIGIILSTIIGGIVLIIVLQIFSKVFKEEVESKNAFLVVLIVSLINYFGVMGIVMPLLSMIPVAGAFIGILLPLLIWILLLRVFFNGMSFLHILVIAVIFYVLTIFLIPMLVGMIAVYIPSF